MANEQGNINQKNQQGFQQRDQQQQNQTQSGGMPGDVSGQAVNKQQPDLNRQQEKRNTPNRTAEGETSSSSIESDDRSGNPTGPANV
jgi:hypothetical protein